LSAEQATTDGWPAAICPSIHWAIALSQGSRSASVSGIPASIIAMLDAGCIESPSANAQPSWSASSQPTVDFPLPETPATIMIMAVLACLTDLAYRA
jgi:hypothetical protein